MRTFIVQRVVESSEDRCTRLKRDTARTAPKKPTTNCQTNPARRIPSAEAATRNGDTCMTGTEQRIDSLLLSYAKQEKGNARGRYHEEESGSFEQGIEVGRLHAMSDVIEFIHENRSPPTDT
jgi:hypothetical protein